MMNAVLAFAALLVAQGPPSTADADARAALALAVARRPAIPVPAPAKVDPPPSPCSPYCTCGCNEGRPCTCQRSSVPFSPPTRYAEPARFAPYSPPRFAPARRGGGC